MSKPLKIAVIGTRGIPANQGGVERHVEELYQRLAQKHDVTVYCRKSYSQDRPDEYKGMKLKYLPNVNTKHFDAISHTFLAAVSSIFNDYDIIHFHAIGPSSLSFIPKLKRRAKIVATVHALDWQRDKWGSFAKWTLKIGEKAAVTFPDLTISVSKEIQAYLKDKYGRDAVYIPNGINKPELKEPQEIDQFGLEKGKYVLFVGRLVPEKNCHLLIKAFKKLDTDFKLVIAGDSGHSNGYQGSLVKEAGGDKRIVFTGLATGRLLQELYTNARLFVLPSSLEGLPVVLLEALSYGLPTICSDIKPNTEVVGENGEYADLFKADNVDDLNAQLKLMINRPSINKERVAKAQEYILNNYDWDAVTQETNSAYDSILTA